jgi:hydrogenase nickel incorporation protein HypA/HybF
MHELSIASNLVELVQQHLDGQESRRVRAVGIRIGGLVDLSPEALQTGYQIVCQETSLAESVLKIETVPIAAQCRTCGRQTEIDRHFYICAHCQSADIEITSGLELDLSWIEFEETSPPEQTVPEMATTGKGLR